MNHTLKVLSVSILFIFFTKFSHAQSNDLQLLAEWMQGSFDSHDQHLKDTANYFDIHLEIIQIWAARKNAIWLYVEQAVATQPEKPYRQRIYQLTEKEPGLYESKVFLLENPLRFAQHSELVEALTPDSIKEKEGCSVFLRRVDSTRYLGGTEGKNCPSDRKGAAYASSEVMITNTMLESWDRGYDAKDEQVWGAEFGAYQFIKR